MTYNVFGWTLNLTQSINHSCIQAKKFVTKLNKNSVNVYARICFFEKFTKMPTKPISIQGESGCVVK